MHPWNLCNSCTLRFLIVTLVCVSPAPGYAQITEIIDETGDGFGNMLDGAVAIAIDSVDNVYVSGSSSDNAFRITQSGTITEIIDATGDGLGHALGGGAGVAVDSSDNVYVGGGDTHNVFRITPTGTITEIIDATGDGLGNTLERVAGVAVDSGDNVLVAGFVSSNVFRVTPTGTITEIIDSTGDGLGNGLANVYSITTDANDNVYAAGVASDNVFRITPAGSITQIIDASGDGLGNPLDEASGVVVDTNGNVYVSGHASSNAFRITPMGTITEIIDSTGDVSHPLVFGFYVAIDSNQNVYVGSDGTFNVFQIPQSGLINQVIDAYGDGLGNQLVLVYGVAVDSQDNVYAAGLASDNVFRIEAPQPIAGKRVAFDGTLEIDLGGFPAYVATDTGVAALVGAVPGALRLPGLAPVATATFLVTDPSLLQAGVRVDATFAGGTVAPVDGQPLTQAIPVNGIFRICAFLPTCPIAAGFPLSGTNPASGLGLGGGAQSIFANHPWLGTANWVADFGQWTVGPATLTTEAASGSYQTVMRTGFLHAATSATTSVLQPDGGLQLVAPTQIVVSDVNNTVVTKVALFSTLTLHFMPEPNALFTLGSGVVVLILLGWRRCGDV